MEVVKGIPFCFSTTRFLIGDIAFDLACLKVSSLFKKLLFIVLSIRGCAELHQRIIRYKIAEFDWDFTCSLFPFFVGIIHQKINKRNLAHISILVLCLLKEENFGAAEGGLSLDKPSPKGDRKIVWDPKPKSRALSIFVAGLLAILYTKSFPR